MSQDETILNITHGKYRSRDHRNATALHHVFTTVYDTWGGDRTTAVAAPTESEGKRMGEVVCR